MDRNTVLIALGFATLAAVFVAIGFRGQERYLATRAERAAEVATTPGVEQPATSWLKSDLSPAERRVFRLLCSAAALGSYLWILFMAFREHIAWGIAVLLGNWLGAVLFTVFEPRQRLFPLFVMTSAYGLSFFAMRA